MEEIDLRILSALEENARASFTELARRTGLSGTAIAERVRRLEDTGVIVGYRAILNPTKVGLAVRAFVCVDAAQADFAKLIALARETPEVKEAHHVEGSHSFLFRVLAPSRDHLESIVESFSAFGSTECAVLLTTPVEKLSL